MPPNATWCAAIADAALAPQAAAPQRGSSNEAAAFFLSF